MEVIDLGIEVLRAEEVANALRIGRTKAYEMIARGELPVVRLGRCVGVPRKSLDDRVAGRIEHSDDCL